MRTDALNSAKVGRNQYICKECGPSKIYGRKDIKVDHIDPVRPVDNPNWTWDEFINRLFCEPNKLQILCESHHSAKTKMENLLRKQYKKDLTFSKNNAKIKKKVK